MSAVLSLLILSLVAAQAASSTPSRVSATSRVSAIVGNMTLEEKLSMLHGHRMCQQLGLPCYTGSVPAIPRLGIPALHMNDGPQGFRAPDAKGTSTCWPSGLTVAATWDVSSAAAWGSAIGKEFRGKGANVALGPGLNVARIPRGGRNFEYLSGEEPALGAALAPAAVQGIQSQGVIANAKHYIFNNQEHDRGDLPLPKNGYSAVVDERTKWEVYMPPFAATVRAGVGSFMCSYNRIHGTSGAEVHACEDNQTLVADLKQTLGFDGWVMSDWFATHSTTALGAGLDQEMPLGAWLSPTALQAALRRGHLSGAQVDASVSRILTPMVRLGVLDRPPSGSLDANVTSAEHSALARALAANASVLLKNTASVLPLGDGAGARRTVGAAASEGRGPLQIAVVGAAAHVAPVVHGGGSGQVVPPYVITPLDGLRERAARLGATVRYDDGANVSRAAALASDADVAIVVVGCGSTEGLDRPSLSLPAGEDALVEAVAAAAHQTVVVLAVPGAILTPWAARVDAILVTWMAGQEAGHALADVLFGDVTPGGRLPLSLPNKENEVGYSTEQYPGAKGQAGILITNYSEGLLIGYRWYDHAGVAAAFPFGHGLSYTTFVYTNLSLSTAALTGHVEVRCDLANTGPRAGVEVAQLYLAFPPTAREPPKVLRRFVKLVLGAGERARVAFTLLPSDFEIWDVGSHGWASPAGEYTVMVGASSADIRLRAPLSRA